MSSSFHSSLFLYKTNYTLHLNPHISLHNPALLPPDGFTVFGVTSYGIGCGSKNHPGVYSTVASHLRFISDVIRHTEAKADDEPHRVEVTKVTRMMT